MIRVLLFLAVAVLIWYAWRRWQIEREAKKLGDLYEEFPGAIPYFPRTKTYNDLTDDQARQLGKIASSPSSTAGAIPCKVTLDDGTEHACVFIAPAQDYINATWEWPEDSSDDDPGSAPIDIERVVRIEESRYRVPPQIAEQLKSYDMDDRGGMRFVAEFSNGDKWQYRLNDYAEFLAAPAGLTFADVVAIHPEDQDSQQLPKGRALAFRWCLHGHGVPPENVQTWKR